MEFALVAPFIILMILGMIYGGIMFIDYFNYNNQARTIAREISVATPDDRDKIIGKYEDYAGQAGIYNVTIKIDYDNEEEPDDVIVNINFGRGDERALFFFMPQNFTIKYRMKLENTTDSSSDTI